MSLFPDPRQKWNSWDQLMQEEPQAQRSSNEVVLEHSDPQAFLGFGRGAGSGTIER
jgi:hypothetical protein